MSTQRVFRGMLVHCVALDDMRILQNAILIVDANGNISHVEGDVDDNRLAALSETFHFNKEGVINLKERQFLVPGFVDTHIHAPQYAYTGTGYDKQLLDWLETYTFPVEARFSDLEFAERVYSRAVRRVLRYGTTTASYFATIHVPATKILVQIIHDHGQRALVGKVCMDCHAPRYYVETMQESYDTALEMVDFIEQFNDPLILATLTPRFAPSCSSRLLEKLGDLAEKRGLHVQSHLAENIGEIRRVSELFPGDHTYSMVYDQFKLLTPKTVMAHCVRLSDSDCDLLVKRGVGVAHCPNSNTSIQNGFMNLRGFLEKGMRVGLGTDVAGGYSPSILDAMRQSINSSKTNAYLNHHLPAISFREALFLATLGGAQALALDSRIGNFEVGKAFDALLVDLDVPDSPVDIFEIDSVEDIISKFIYNGDDRNIRKIYIQGKDVTPPHDRPHDK